MRLIRWGRRAREEERGRRLLASGSFEAAAECYEQLVSRARDPRHPVLRRFRRRAVEARLDLGLARFHAGRDAEAEAEFTRVLWMAPGHPGARRYRARVFQRSGRLRDAIADLAVARLAAPEDADACLVLAVCLRALGELAEADRALERAVALGIGPATQGPARPDARRVPFAHLTLRRRAAGPRRDGALVAATRAVRERPSYPDLRYRRALLLLRRARTAEAEVELERALRINPDYFRARLLAARLEIARGRSHAAARRLEGMLGSHAGYPDLHFWLALALVRAGDAAAAVVPLERAVALNRHFARAQRLLGLLYHRLERPAEAWRCLSRGLARDREVEVGTLVVLRDPHSGLFADEGAIERDVAQRPHYPDLRLALAGVLRRRGELEGAREACGEALSLHPGYDAAALEMARLELELERPERARRLLAGLVRRHPLWADAHALLGRALRQRGNRWEAELPLRQALRLNPDYGEAREDLAWALASGAQTIPARETRDFS